MEIMNSEDLSRLLDSWAKYISARKNSDVFEKESAEEREQREMQETIKEVMRG